MGEVRGGGIKQEEYQEVWRRKLMESGGQEVGQ